MTRTLRTKVENFLNTLSSIVPMETLKDEFEYAKDCCTDCDRDGNCSSQCVEDTVEDLIGFLVFRYRLEEATLTRMWREA